eukprot:m.30226 g.30226  ORF g.30226 m.30226 type:complete len:1003 (+) comp16237_c0_seq1:262-3270(+)
MNKAPSPKQRETKGDGRLAKKVAKAEKKVEKKSAELDLKKLKLEQKIAKLKKDTGPINASGIETYRHYVQLVTKANEAKMFATDNESRVSPPQVLDDRSTTISLTKMDELLPVDIDSDHRRVINEVNVWICKQVQPDLDVEQKRSLARAASTWLVDALKHAHLDRQVKDAATSLLGCAYFTKNMEYFDCFDDPFRSGLRAYLVALGNGLKQHHNQLDLKPLSSIEIESVTRYHALASNRGYPQSSSGNSHAHAHANVNVAVSGPTAVTSPSLLSQLDCLPSLPLSNANVVTHERCYLHVLRLVAIATDELFQQAVCETVTSAGLDSDSHFHAIQPKSYVRMLNAMHSRDEHRYLSKPRGRHNTDVLRNIVIASSPSELKTLYKGLVHKFDGVGSFENRFSLDEASRTKHFDVLSLIVTVFFCPQGVTFGSLCNSPSVKAAWERYRNTAKGEPPSRWRTCCDQALAFLRGSSISSKPVRLLCEIQMLLVDDARVQRQMYSPHKAWRAATGNLLYLSYKHESATEQHRDGVDGDVVAVTTLSAACASGQLETAKMCVKAGANVHYTAGQPPPILSAALNGHDDVTELLLNNNVDIDQQGQRGETALFKACENDHHDVATLLLDRNATVDQPRTDDGFTPLAMASINGHVQVVELLLDRGALVNQSNPHTGDTCLHMASQHGHLDVVSLLLARGANVNQPRHDSTTPLHVACTYGYLDIVALLLDQSALVNCADCDGFPALHMASQHGHIDVVSMLLDQNAVLDHRSNTGSTAVYVAAQSGHAHVVKLLLSRSRKLPVDQHTLDGSTPLHAAAHRGHASVVTTLLKLNANVARKDGHGATALHMASQNGFVDVVGVLLDYHASVDERADNGASSLLIAAQKGHHALVWLLLNRNSDVNQHAEDGRTALHMAAQHGYVDVATLVLGQGAVVDCKAADGRTALCLAAQTGHLEIVKLLVEHNADLNVSSVFGSPLHSAASRNHNSVVQYLRNHGGADLEHGMRMIVV